MGSEISADILNHGWYLSKSGWTLSATLNAR
jgi:hypothetical protein